MSATFTPLEFVAWIGRTADYLNHYYDASNSVLDHLRGHLAQSVQENFEKAKTPAGEKWLPVRRKVPPPPLVRTGDMKLAAIEAAYHAVAGEVSLSIDTSLLPSYWVYQQFGTDSIPAREFLGFPDDFLDRAAELVGDDVIERLAPS